jgi:hypothetical protein
MQTLATSDTRVSQCRTLLLWRPVHDVPPTGAVHYLVIESRDDRFPAVIAPALVRLVRQGYVEVLDLVHLSTDCDGTFRGMELLDGGVAAAWVSPGPEIAEQTSGRRITGARIELEAGEYDEPVVYENARSAPLASAVRRAGSVLLADGRVPIHPLVPSSAVE